MRKIFSIILAFATMGLHAQLVDENFESSDGGWIGSSDSGSPYWEWGAPSGTLINDDNDGGGNAWVTGLSGDFTIEEFEVMYLTSQPYDLSSLTTTGSVSLAINYDLGSFNIGIEVNDGTLLEYSIDGFSWTELGAPGTGNNWYDEVEGVWVGNSGGWIIASHDLPVEVLGEPSVQFRLTTFSAAPAGTYGFEGFALDNFTISSTSAGGGSGGSTGGGTGGSGGGSGVNPDTEILTFSLEGEVFPAVINDVAASIKIFVAPGTDITALAPVFTLASGATVDVASETARDFTNPLTYTVTSEDGLSTTEWTVTAVVPNIGLRLLPASGVEGSQVSIYGRGFSTVATENVVTFGEQVVNVVDATANKLTIEVPSGVSLGLNEVTTNVNGITSQGGTYFNVLSSNVTGIYDEYRETDFNLNASSIVKSMEVGDLDGDGDLDLVYDNETILNISTLENGRIQSTVNKISGRTSGSDSFEDISIADVDGDGLLDIIVGGSRVGWYKNNGDGTWADESIIDELSSEFTIRILDLDGDFDVDILSDDGSSVYSYTNDGEGNFTENTKTTPFQFGQLIDWDEDGDMDMVSISGAGNQIVLSANDGSGNFTDGTLHTTSVSSIDLIQFGDLDNDGDLDFVYGTADTGTSVSLVGYILNNGDGTFSTETTISTEGIFNNTRFELGDLNNDGFLDIARTKNDGSNGVFQVYLSSGLLTYTGFQTLDDDAGGLDLILVDIEQDGDLDLLQEASQSGGYFPLFLRLIQDAEILSFSMAEETGSAAIDGTNNTISIEVNATADITSLVPVIEISPGASISPDTGVAQDFSGPVNYTITPEDPATTPEVWTVSVSQVPSVPVLSSGIIQQESASVTWSVSNNAATGFELQLSTVEDFSVVVTDYNPLAISGIEREATLSGLVAGTTYYARIRALNGLGTTSDYSTAVNFLTISATPVAQLATEVLAESFVANWDAANGAATYQLEVSVDNFTSTVFTGNTSETSLAVTGLTEGTAYSYRVSSTNTTGTSGYSNVINLTTNAVPEDITLDVESVNENQDIGTVIGTLRTTDTDDTIHTYELVEGTGGDDNASFDIEGTSLITSEVFNFETRDQYSIRVQTTDPSGSSISSAFVIEIRDLNDAPSSIALETSPYSPTGFDPVGTGVADLFATDEDGDDVTFSLTAGGESFSVNNTTKTLVTEVIFENEVDLTIPVTLQATDPDGASVSESFEITINAFVDTERPVLTPSPQNGNTFLSGGPERSLSVMVEDFRLSEVRFFSRLLTESEFISEVLTEAEGSYTKLVQEADLGVAGFEYYFEATDEAGNTGFSDLETMALAFPESGENAPKVESVTKFGRTVDSYQIISIPFAFTDPSAKRVDAIFNEYSGDEINREYRIIKWDPTSGESGELVNLDQASTIELGEGYFFISANERSITIESANINLQDPFPLALRQGWNLVGNPYNIDIDWSSVLTNNGATGIVGALRVLDPENPETWPESNILKTLEGAFVFANQDITLNMSYTDASITFGGGRIAGPPTAEWFLPLTLEQNGDFRRGGIGMDHRADLLLDEYDEPVLPKWLEYLEIAFLHEGERFSRFNKDVVPFADTRVWEFEVSSSSNGASVLKWDESSSQVANLKLYNTQNGVVIDMTKQSSYQFELNGTSKFKILYSEDTDATFDFEELGTMEAYPNPFTESFKVPMTLPVNGYDYNVKVNLLDLSGRTLFSGKEANVRGGAFEYSFKRPLGLKPGIYLYKVSVENALNSSSYTKRIQVR